MAIKSEDLLAAARQGGPVVTQDSPPLGEEGLGEGPEAYVEGVPGDEGIPADIAELDSMVEEAVDTHRTFGGIAEAVEDTLELPEGGMSEPAATAISVAVEAFSTQIGFSPKIFPNLHHFSQPSRRAVATQMVLEDLKETMTKIGEAIMAALRKILEAIGEMIRNLSQFYNDRSAKARKFLQSLQGMEEGKDVTFTPPTFCKALTVNGVLPKRREFVYAYKDHHELVADILKEEGALARTGCAAAEEAFKQSADPEAVKTLLTEAMHKYAGGMPGRTATRLSNYDVKVNFVDMVFGDQQYISSCDTEFNEHGSVKNYRRELKLKDGADSQLPQEIDALSLGEVSELTSLSINNRSVLDVLEATMAEIHATARKLQAATKQQRASLASGSGVSRSGAMNYSFLHNVVRVVFNGCYALTQYSSKIDDYIFQLCMASANAHRKATEPAGE